MVGVGVPAKESSDGGAEGDSALRRGGISAAVVDAHVADRMARRMPECAIAVFTFAPESETVFKALLSDSPYPGAEPVFDERICRRSFREAAQIGLDGLLVPIEGDLVAKTLSAGAGHQNVLASAQSIDPELAALVAIAKPREFGPFREPDLGGVRELVQCVFALLRVHSTYAAKAIAYLSNHLQELEIGFIVASPELHKLGANDIGERVLQEDDFLILQNGRLELADSAADVRLRQLLPHVLNTSGTFGEVRATIPMQNQGRSRLARCALTVLRDGDESLLGSPLIGLTVLTGREDQNISPKRLQRLGLSPAEARLTAALLKGVTIKQYARQEGIAVPTARAHVKRAMLRLGVSRQQDLIRYILNLS